MLFDVVPYLIVFYTVWIGIECYCWTYKLLVVL